MKINQNIIKRTLGASLLIFPSILLLSFVMHLHSFGGFFNFRLKQRVYNSDELFGSLIKNGSESFIHAHELAYLSVPFIILTLLCLGYLLYQKKPILSFIGVVVGILGSVFLSSFFGAYTS